LFGVVYFALPYFANQHLKSEQHSSEHSCCDTSLIITSLYHHKFLQAIKCDKLAIEVQDSRILVHKAIINMSAVVDASAEGQAYYASIFTEMQQAMGGQDPDGQPCYQDIHEWFEKQYQTADAQAALVKDLEALEAECRQVLQLQPGAYTTSVPDKASLVKSSSEVEKKLTVLKLRVWQLDFKRAGQVKSGASLHAVRDCLRKNLVGVGNETAKYPARCSVNCSGLLSFDRV
jgi:hypothetical protein